MENNVQFGTSATGDFELSTWTFEMPEDFKIWAGEFVIIPKEDYIKLTKQI